ncbi:MAG: Flp family type IVb pilin [Candidatus Binatia bacterium]
MKNGIMRFINDEEGAAAIEYGLIAGLVSVVIVTALTSLGASLQGIFNFVAGKLVVPTTPAP